MKSNNRVPRGILALIAVAVLAILVWRLAPNNFFYPSILIASCLAIGIVLLIYRSPRNSSNADKSKKNRELSESKDANLGSGDLVAETVPPVEDISPWSHRSMPGFGNPAEKPKATEVAAWYMKMAAIARAEEEERNTLKPLTKSIEATIEELTSSKPALDEAEPAESKAELDASGEKAVEPTQNETPEATKVVEPVTGEPPMPIINEETILAEEDKNQLENAVWYRCENPYCKYSHFLDVHHIVDEKDGGTNKLENLIVLCPYCHDLAHKNEIPEKELRDWISNREERFKFKLEWRY